MVHAKEAADAAADDVAAGTLSAQQILETAFYRTNVQGGCSILPQQMNLLFWIPVTVSFNSAQCAQCGTQLPVACICVMCLITLLLYLLLLLQVPPQHVYL